jgi:FAD/FMN-containing dehydrogenase
VTAHDAKVDAVCAQVRELATRGEPVHIAKGGVHHFVPLPGDTRFSGRAVDVSALSEVLSVDVEAKLCVAEPGATVAAVVQATLAHGLLPKVVPELEGITLGGMVAGCSVESMSYRYGGFHDTCREYEIVTGDGRRRVLGPGDELFHMVHGSYGTLAILTRVVFELVEAQPFVRVENRRHGSFESFEADLRACMASDDVDFADGIVHGPHELVVCAGSFAARGPATYEPRRDGPYYRRTRVVPVEHMRVADYLFRYDPDCHWLSRTAPPLEWRPVRRAVGRWFLGSENLIRWTGRLEWLTRRVMRRPDVVVDVFIPASRFGDFFGWYAGELDYWPLWVVPYRIDEPYPWIADGHAARMTDTLMIDCAVYGKRNVKRDVDWSQVIEEKTHELGGIKTLISSNHYTRERFWEIYSRDRWQAAKRELDPKGLFRDLYEKFAPPQ